MADSDVKIRIGEEGAEKTVGAIASISKAFHALSAPLLKVRDAAAALFKTLGTVSFVIHGIALVIDSVKRLHDWMESSRKASAEMANALLMDRFADSLDKAAERAKRLKGETAETIENLKELQRRETAERESDKAVKGASLNLEEQRALSGVTDADERQRISDDFRLRRADLDASGKAREANDTRKAINSQINAALESLGKEERYRTAREPDRERMYRAWLNWRPADSKGRDEFAKRQDEIRGANPSLSESAVREKALGQMEEAKKRKAVLDKMDEEIAASDARTKELNKLVESLKHERTLLDKSVQNSELQRRAVYQEVANAQAERERKRRENEKRQVEEFEGISARNKARSEREEAQEKIDTLSDDLSKGRKSLSSDPETQRAQDRISAMGGFATAGAAALSGVSSLDKSYEELRKQNDLMKQQINELRKIVKNTEESVATFG